MTNKNAQDVKALVGRKWATWGEFKTRLVEIGVIPSFYSDCPLEWMVGWLRFSGREQEADRLSRWSEQ